MLILRRPAGSENCKKCLDELGFRTHFYLYIEYHKNMFKISGTIYRNPLLLVSYVLETYFLSLDFDN